MGSEVTLGFVIRRRDGAHEMWLLAEFPAIKWGPRQHAKCFATRPLARRALGVLPTALRAASEILANETPV